MGRGVDFPQAAAEALLRLEEAGYEAYFVGGCVRDMLLGKRPADFDLASSAEPEEVAALFADKKLLFTGAKHGTVAVQNGGLWLEITTFRKDGAYNDRRHPSSVAFSHSAREDAARRDFTVNAMFYSPYRGLLDFYSGQSDLRAGVIRCVGDAEKRFREDALRILRALRFAAKLGFVIEENTSAAMLKTAEGLRDISAERIAAELRMFLALPGCAGLCAEYLPVFSPRFGRPASQPSDFHALEAVSEAFRLPLFAALYGRTEAESLLKGLKVDRQSLRLGIAAKEALYCGALEDAGSAAEAVLKYGAAAFADMLAAAEALKLRVWSGAHKALSGLQSGEIPCTLSDLAVSGNDLNAAGICGAETGRVQRRLFLLTFSGFPNEKEALLKEAQKLKKNGEQI